VVEQERGRAAGELMHLALILRAERSEQDREKKMPEAVKWLIGDLLSSPSTPLLDVHYCQG